VIRREVFTGEEFASAILELRTTLDDALASPAPAASSWEERRGGWWRNWDLVSWVNGSHSARADSIQPVDAELTGIWQVLLPERAGGEQDLRDHLTCLSVWAVSGIELSPQAWNRAFQVLRAGAIRE
jgi:hypothetical protein